ncbi:MAG: DUF4830 domain-containing protein [Ruminococcaceae bacterium]|nr:DUF4830 domain-containing protein [Oscillospiraceae bacterium]
MFIYSFKASTLKFFGVIGIAVITLVALAFLIPQFSIDTTREIALMNENISFDNVKSAKDAVDFLGQYGWQVMETPTEECEITIPKEFDKVISSYNEIQKQQGLDLTKYSKKTAQRYTFKVMNYPNYEGTVYANVITYRGKVIAGDICTADAKGFIHTLPMPNNATN